MGCLFYLYERLCTLVKIHENVCIILYLINKMNLFVVLDCKILNLFFIFTVKVIYNQINFCNGF